MNTPHKYRAYGLEILPTRRRTGAMSMDLVSKSIIERDSDRYINLTASNYNLAEEIQKAKIANPNYIEIKTEDHIEHAELHYINAFRH